MLKSVLIGVVLSAIALILMYASLIGIIIYTI